MQGHLYKLSATIAVILTLTYAGSNAYAQVEVQQSQSSSVNGQYLSSETNVNPHDNQTQTTIVHMDHGTVIITGDRIQYCIVMKLRCGPEYKLKADGTITK